MKSTLAGAVSGFAATLPMTIVMQRLHQRLPAAERYPLPPREITMKLSQEAGIKEDLSLEERTLLTYAAHFGYGMLAGALYGWLISERNGSSASKGASYGLSVWGASYLGLLPLLGVLKPATKHPPRRNLLMVVAHLVWGAALGASIDLLSPRNEITHQNTGRAAGSH